MCEINLGDSKFHTR